uniref:Cyclic nucleotide-binding domain-containing protein n=1 Tax=Neobodo designis TaxID=312471 RepID=A0A7S1Q9V2_NEODS|mmetsp:Transcript_3567/g.11144  ORF Transcript_3567/g.11144 Transcript_3567/m.11144 type:complete len:916 (+) Transcript_3567:33-2780(+)
MWNEESFGSSDGTASDSDANQECDNVFEPFTSGEVPRTDDAAATATSKRRASLFDNVSREMMDQSVPKVDRAPRQRARFFGLESSTCDDGDGGKSRRDSSVRATMLRRRTMRQEHLQQLVDRANRRLEVAQSRRQFLKTEPDAKAAAMWMSILAAYVFVYRIDTRRGIHFALTLFARRLGPVTRLKQLRMRRNHRRAQLLRREDLRRPTPEDLLSDNILRHFGAVHARTVIPTMTTRVYLAGETLMYQGESGDECFFISHGRVGIKVRTGKGLGQAIETQVATSGAGALVGAIGMISGERRQARVFAETDIVVYVIRRQDFLRSAADMNVMEIALAEIHRQHKENIPKIYASEIEGPALSKYHLFQGVAPELLDKMRSRKLLHATAFQAGEIIVAAGSPSNRMHFILCGTVQSHKEKKTVTSVENPAELLANMADVSISISKGERKKFFQRCTEDGSKQVPGVLKEKTVIGGPAFLLMEPYPLTLVAQTPVDTMSIDSRDFVQLMLEDPSAFKHMRSRACDALASWLKPMQKHLMLQAMFPDLGSSTMNALRVYQRRGWFDPTPQVILRGEVVEFNADNRFAYIIVSGSFDGVQPSRPGQPVMWPPAPLLFFGHFDTAAKVLHRVEAWRVSRRDFLTVLRAALNEEKMSQLYVEMASHVDNRPGKAPAFEDLAGLNIPNPFLGTGPPPQAPPAATRRRRDRRASIASHSSDKQHGEALAQEPVVNNDAIEEESYHGGTSANPSTPSRSRRASVLVLDVDETPPAPSDRNPMLPERRARIPILPSAFTGSRGRIPMREAIDAAVSRVARRLPSPERAKSPPCGPSRPRSPPTDGLHARTARPTRAVLPQISDPYTRLFGETEIADILRDSDQEPRPPKPKLKSVPGAAVHSTASRHAVRLDDVRRNLRKSRPANTM